MSLHRCRRPDRTVPGPLTPERSQANLAKCVAFTPAMRGGDGAELVVLPESATTVSP